MATKSVVSLVVTGQVGLNLQATKSAAGAFVDSFYRGTNLDTGVEYKLPAESILGVDLFGAIILTVDGKDVSALAAMDICKLISSANRPLTLEFLQHDQEVHGSLSVINYASLPWMLEHLEVLERENFEIPNESLSLLRGKLLCYVECERVLSNIDLLKTGQHGKLTLFLKSLMTPFPELISITSFPDCDHNLIEIASSLKDDLDKDFFPLFRQSLSMRRMQGYLHRSHSCNNLSFTDLLTNSTAKMYLFLFMSRSNRRYNIC